MFGARRHDGRHERGEALGRLVVDRVALDEAGLTGVGLDDERSVGRGAKLGDESRHLLGGDLAVGADHVGAGVEQSSRRPGPGVTPIIVR